MPDLWLRRASIICQLGLKSEPTWTCSPSAIDVQRRRPGLLHPQGDRLGIARLRAHGRGLGAATSSRPTRRSARCRGGKPSNTTIRASGGNQARRWAPADRRAAATAASRAAAASSTVSVRSGARNRSAKASDFDAPAPSRCVVGVDVEQPHRLEQRPGAVAQRGHDSAGGHRRPRRRARRRAAPAGSAEIAGAGAGAGGGEARRDRAPSRRCARAGRASAITRGCSSPAWPTTAPSEQQLGAAARMPGRVRRPPGRRARPARRRATSAGRLDRVGPARPARPAPHQPARLDVAGEHDGRACRGWSGTAASSAASSASDGPVRPTPGAAPAAVGRRPGRPGPISNSARSRLPRPTLRRSVASSPGSSVVRSSRLGVRERVGQPQRAPARVVGGQAERVVHRRRRRTGSSAPRRSRRRRARATTVRRSAAPRSARGRAAASAAPTASCRSRRAARPPRPGRPGSVRSGRQRRRRDLRARRAPVATVQPTGSSATHDLSRVDRHAGQLRPARLRSQRDRAAGGAASPTTV